MFFILLTPFIFVGTNFYISILIVLIVSYILIKKRFISKMEDNFTIKNYELLMKKSRQIGFLSMIISTALCVLFFYMFTEGFINYLCEDGCEDGYFALFAVFGLMGFFIVFAGFLGAIIAEFLTDREIRKYL